MPTLGCVKMARLLACSAGLCSPRHLAVPVRLPAPLLPRPTPQPHRHHCDRHQAAAPLPCMRQQAQRCKGHSSGAAAPGQGRGQRAVGACCPSPWRKRRYQIFKAGAGSKGGQEGQQWVQGAYRDPATGRGLANKVAFHTPVLCIIMTTSKVLCHKHYALSQHAGYHAQSVSLQQLYLYSQSTEVTFG